MVNPFKKYFKNLFASKRIVGYDPKLKSLVKADTILQALVDGKKVPGLAITVIKKGNTLIQKGYGYADLDKSIRVQPQHTIFRIASISKNIAATALAHMVNDGLLDLDTSYHEYVPYFPKKKWDFTIRQLASHTAGIRGYQGTEYGLNKPYTIKESIEIFAADDLLFEPGTNYMYTSFAWVLISLAMQEVSGIPFDAYVWEKVLKPLGMMNTFAPLPTMSSSGLEALGENRATFYSKNRLGFREAIPVHNYYKLAGGGYLSTSEDIAKFGQAYLDGKVLNEAALAQFITSESVNGNKTYYGLGWQVSEDKKGRPYFGHIGNGVGGYSNFFVYPEQQMVFALLIHCTNPNVQEELDAVIETLISEVNKGKLL